MKAVSDPMEKVLSRLDGVKLHGRGHLARCPAHHDRNPSLSIREGDDGRVLVHCFAGCDVRDVARAMGLGLGDLFLDPISPVPTDQRRHVVRAYQYRDAGGDLLYEVVRFEPKDFRQRRPDGEGGWTWNLGGVARVLFRLPELLVADPFETVFVCEGEKDADRLAAVGLIATTNAGGAGKWREEYSESLSWRNVAILADNDKPGGDHAEQVARSLSNVAKSVRIVRLPGLGNKQDVADWLAEGGTAAQLQEIVSATPLYEQEADDPHDEEPTEDADEGPRLYMTYGPDDLKAMPPLAFRVEGWLPENSLIGIIGKSGDMKSFFALDQAFSIAMNHIWNGCDVCGGPVLYVAAEGRSGIGQRITAWETARHVALDNDRFRLITDAPQMLTDEHVDALIATVKHWGAEIVYLDTLARTIGGDENTPKDMGAYVTACNRIQRETGATVCVVHHMGWNGERMRGHSSLFAAMDAEITVTKDGDTVTAKVTKAKDFPDGAEMTFTPRVVELENGGTSVVLDRKASGIAAMTGAAKRIGNILWDTFGDTGATLSEWKRVCLEKKIAETSFFEGRRALDKGDFITKPTTTRGHHYTVTEAFWPFIAMADGPNQPKNLSAPSAPIFSADIASNPEMAAREGANGRGEGVETVASEGAETRKAKSAAIATENMIGAEGADRFFEGAETFTEDAEEDRCEGLPPPIGGKPSHLRPTPSAPEPEEIVWEWIVAVKAEREFGMPDALLAAAARLGCALDRFASAEEEAARLADHLDRHAAMTGSV